MNKVVVGDLSNSIRVPYNGKHICFRLTTNKDYGKQFVAARHKYGYRDYCPLFELFKEFEDCPEPKRRMKL